MSDPPPQKNPRKALKKAAAAPIPPDVAADLVAGSENPEFMKAMLALYAADPERFAVVLAEQQRQTAEYERLRGELANAALELHQRAVIPVGAPQPPPGPVPAGKLVKVLAMNVKLARVELGLSQDELAVASGIGRKQISAIENGANTTIETIERLARHLNRTPAELLTKR